MSVVFYDSASDFLAACPLKNQRMGGSNGIDWYGGQTYEQARVNLFKGKPDAVERSNALLDKLESDGIETSRLQWEHDRVGFVPCVPSYLANSPFSMRRPVETQTDQAPIRIFASVCCSAGLNAPELEARGTAVLALCRKLQMHRTVELWAFAEMYGVSRDSTGNCAIPLIRIETSPLDLTTASYILTDAGFLRRLCFNWAQTYGFNGHWAWNLSPTDADAAMKRREVFRAEPQDLVIPGGYASDPIVRQPLQWVQEQLAKYTEQKDA